MTQVYRGCSNLILCQDHNSNQENRQTRELLKFKPINKLYCRHSPTAAKRKKLEMDTPLDLTGRYKEKTIHKFLKDDILDIIRSQNAVFQPFFDPETYPDLELIIVDGKIGDSYGLHSMEYSFMGSE